MKSPTICAAIVLMAILACSASADWTTPMPVTELNTSGWENGPLLSNDGLTIYFNRWIGQSLLFQATRGTVGSPFTSIGPIIELNVPGQNTSFSWVSQNGLKMYYTQDRKFRVATRSSVFNPWSPGPYLVELNTYGNNNIDRARLSIDECSIVFESVAANGKWDMHTASRPDKNVSFENMMLLSELNTDFHDNGQCLSADGLTIYFHSDRSGSWNIYQAKRASYDESFGTPEIIVSFAGFVEPAISMDGQTMMLTTSGSNHDIYVSYLVIEEVAVDIRPANCPNPFNLASKGVLPVAILGSEGLDVNDIDIASIRLAGVAAVRSSLEDVASPVTDNADCNCSEEGPDGFVDLVLKFDTQQLAEALIAENGVLARHDVITVNLTGSLLDDTPIKGEDCVVIVGNPAKPPPAGKK